MQAELDLEYTDARLVQMSANYSLMYVAFSTAIFYRISTKILPEYIPLSISEKYKKWMFKNICNSLIHSSIASLWIGFILWKHPEHKSDFINVYSNQSLLLISFSVGYFIFDFFDMWMNDFDNSFILLGHHLVVMGIFGVTLYSRYYLGYAMFGLMVEVNSVFLHIRTLMRIMEKCNTTFYLCICILNLVTFTIFRLYLLAYLTQWLLLHKDIVAPLLFITTLPSLIIINGMSWLLFFQTSSQDFGTPISYCLDIIKEKYNTLVLYVPYLSEYKTDSVSNVVSSCGGGSNGRFDNNGKCVDLNDTFHDKNKIL